MNLPYPPLNASEAAIWETVVVPRYCSFFGNAVLEALIESEQAQVVHIGCRTGYPDRGIAMKLIDSTIVAVDPSSAALALARAKAVTMVGMTADYRGATDVPLSLPTAAFSHGVWMNPTFAATDVDLAALRQAVWSELHRLIAPAGKVVVTAPLAGSFIEVTDLFAEYAVKFEEDTLLDSMNAALANAATTSSLKKELQAAGFHHVEMVEQSVRLEFSGGRDLADDPVVRLAILPEIARLVPAQTMAAALAYARDAVDTYGGGRGFAITLNVGCATGRR